MSFFHTPGIEIPIPARAAKVPPTACTGANRIDVLRTGERQSELKGVTGNLMCDEPFVFILNDDLLFFDNLHFADFRENGTV